MDDDPDDERELIEGILKGEPWAAAAIVSTSLPSLLGFAEVIAPDLGEADREEAVEHALWRSIERIDEFDQTRGVRFGTWTRGFVRYAIADIRRDRGSPLPIDDNADALRPPDAASPASQASEDLQWELLKLPVPDQVIVALRFHERLTYKQISEVLGASEGACRTRCSRALRRLEEILADNPVYEAYVDRADEEGDKR